MNKREAAYHEAGHVIVAKFCNKDVTEARIIEGDSGSWSGTTAVFFNTNDRVSKALYYLAGQVAQDKISPNNLNSIFNASSDSEEAKELIDQMANNTGQNDNESIHLQDILTKYVGDILSATQTYDSFERLVKNIENNEQLNEEQIIDITQDMDHLSIDDDIQLGNQTSTDIE